MKINNNCQQNFSSRYLITGQSDPAIIAAKRMIEQKKNSCDVFQFNYGKEKAIIIATDEDAKTLKDKKSQKDFCQNLRKIYATSNEENTFKNIFKYIFGTIEDTRWIKGRTLAIASNPIYPINMNANSNGRFAGVTTYHTEEFLDGSWKNFGSSGKLNNEGLQDGTKIDYKDGVEIFYPDGSRIKYYPDGSIKETQDTNGVTKFFDTPVNNSRLEAIQTPNDEADEFDIIQYFYDNYDELSFALNSQGLVGLEESNGEISWYSIDEIVGLDVPEKQKTQMRDRILQATFADGTTMYCNDKGEIVKKELSTHSTVMYENGVPAYKDMAIRKTELFYDDFGELLFEAPKHRSNSIVAKNGTVVSDNEVIFEKINNKTLIFTKKDDKWFKRVINPDGSSIVKDMYGTVYEEINKDGTIIECIPEENKIIITNPDGSMEVYQDNKLLMFSPADKLIADSDDYYKIASEEIDGANVRILYNSKDEFIGEIYPDGKRTYYFGNRLQAADFPDGTREKYDSQGRRIVLVTKEGRIDKFSEITRRLTNRIMPDGTKYLYDFDEDIIKETTPNGVEILYHYGRDSYGRKTFLFKVHSDGLIESQNGVVDMKKRTITFSKESGVKVVYDEFCNVINPGLLDKDSMIKIYPQ